MVCAAALMVVGVMAPGAPAQAQDQRALIADMQVRITQLEDLVRSLTGQLEQAQHRTRQLEQRVDLLEREQDMRLGGAAGTEAAPGTSGAPSDPASGPALAPDTGVLGYLPQPAPGEGRLTSPAPPPSGGATAAALPPGPPEQQYQHAFSVLREGDYAAAERAFSAFVQTHPNHTLAGNAQYWLGETHYARGDYESAAVAFAKGYKEYQDGSKTPDNLFKLGMSMSALGKNREACAAFQKLRADYPNVSGTLQRQVADQMARNGC
ncbi:tol-pal system protein YbgF [uncultured Rhodospira sp.]|uniref:tol-pal system protein YbgF n=1 Tax=uncultured Rhodospira sp. TaxID=1936189 RepID=UPI00262E1B0F|nr:tol-pal system protein YbgF [uncultured Rhodospira sp.]